MNTRLTSPDLQVAEARTTHTRAALRGAAILFVIAFLVRFMEMSRSVSFYDEGIALTGAMRVMAGQIPHRDFYANYGPLEFYSFGLVFKIFGATVLTERLFCLTLESLTVATVYAVALRYCRRWIAIGAALLVLTWIYAMNVASGSAIIPVALLNLYSCLLLLPLFTREVAKGRLVAAGMLAAASALYRYDTGAALLGVECLLIGLAAWVRSSGGPGRLRSAVSSLWPYLLGFALFMVPAVIGYLAVAPLKDFVHDMILYPAKYYRPGRALPLPGIHLRHPGQLGFYVPVAVLVCVTGALALSDRDRGTSGWLEAWRLSARQKEWMALLCMLAPLAFILYFKGLVRTGYASAYLALMPSVVMLAILLEHRPVFSRLFRVLIPAVAVVSTLLIVFEQIDTAMTNLSQHSVPGRIARVLFFPNRPQPAIQATWCSLTNPVTKGFCFLPDDGRIQTIQFLEAHTTPDQKLFVGLRRHDIVFANDNLLYFATQLLPATKWSHFDPGLQNTYPIQQDMIREFEATRPPYIVLDSEFEGVHEPNDSSKSTGVTLLDDYIHGHYRQVQVFDEMAVWQRD